MEPSQTDPTRDELKQRTRLGGEEDSQADVIGPHRGGATPGQPDEIEVYAEVGGADIGVADRAAPRGRRAACQLGRICRAREAAAATSDQVLVVPANCSSDHQLG